MLCVSPFDWMSKGEKNEKISSGDTPTACGALFSARTTPQPSQNLVEPSWNLGGTLVEPSWNLASGPPQTTPEPIWVETPKLSAVGEKQRRGMPGQSARASGRFGDSDFEGLMNFDEWEPDEATWSYLCLHFGADEHPCTTYFDVHQGYRVLTHSHMEPDRGAWTTIFGLEGPGPERQVPCESVGGSRIATH